MQPGEVRLSIDCGSVGAVAVLSWPDGRWTPLLFDGVARLPAVVYVEQDRALVVGAAAWQRAASSPERFVPAPIRRLGDGRVTLGDGDVEVVDLVAAVLRRVGEEATAVAQQPIADVRLVVPAGWGPRRRTAMRQAAHRAGLGQPTLVEAPVAAAQHLLAAGTQLVVGSYVAVCDLGGGFEATVLRRTPTGFEVLSTLDAPDAGGLQVDEVLADELAGVAADQSGEPGSDQLTAGDRLALLTSARTATEALAHSAAVAVTRPAPRPAVVLNSTQLEALARPVLARAADTTREAIDAAGLAVAGLYAVGGSVYFDLPTGAFLRWAILPVLPIAATATVTAVLAARWRRIPPEGWHAWLNFPVSSVLLAAAGMLLIQVSMPAKVYPTGALLNS